MTIFDFIRIIKKQRIWKFGVLGFWRFWRFWRFWQISGFPGFGQIRGFPGRVPVPARSGDLAGSAKSGVFPGSGNRGFWGPKTGFSGVPDPGKKHTFRDDGFSCIEQLGPGFWTFFSKSNEIWGPGAEKSGFLGPRKPGFPGSENRVFRGPKTGFSGVLARFRVFGVLARFRGFGGFGGFGRFRVPWGLKVSFWGFKGFWGVFLCPNKKCGLL